MANDFLTSSVIPGSKIEHHEHRRLITVLAIVIVIGILGFLGYRWNASTQFWPTNNEVSTGLSQRDIKNAQIGQELEKSGVPATTKEKIDAAVELKKSVVPLSEREKIDASQDLLKSIVK